jgi:hypothetical protein
MRRARATRLGIASGVIAAILLAGASVSSGDVRKSERSKWRVRQVLTVQYSTKFCHRSGDQQYDFAYKVNNWSRRWSRRTRTREVPRATFLAHAAGVTCDGDNFMKKVESDLRPCFGCDGYSSRWTPDYHGSPSWPYIYPPEQPELFPFWGLRFKLTGTVARRTGREVGDICTPLTLFGPVPVC